MKKLIYIIIATDLMFSIQSCYSSSEDATNNIGKRNSDTRKYKMKLVNGEVVRIGTLARGFSIGDTVDAYPEITGPVIPAVIIDTL